jgi:hypothetical protein
MGEFQGLLNLALNGREWIATYFGAITSRGANVPIGCEAEWAPEPVLMWQQK